MVLTISTLELSVVAAAITGVSVVAIGVNAAPSLKNLVEDTTEDEADHD